MPKKRHYWRQEAWTDVQVRDEPIYGWEPAVIIGPYVLTGWGPREVQQEQSRRSSELAQSAVITSTRRAPVFAVAALLLSLIALLLIGRAMSGAGGTVFVVLASLASIGCVWQAALDYSTALGKPQAVTLAQYRTAATGLLLLLLEWCVARCFIPLSWLTPVILAAAVITILTLSAKLE